MEVRVVGSCLTWAGGVTWRHTAALREQIFDLLEEPAILQLFLDVSSVDRIDRTGVALLVGANQWAAAMNRQLVLIDRSGLITTALTDAKVRDDFVIRSDRTSQQAPPG